MMRAAKSYLQKYVDLIEQFLDGVIDADEFQSGYLGAFKADQTDFRSDEFEVLNYLFSSCDMYCGNPDLCEEGDLTSEELRRDALKALSELNDMQRGRID